MKFRSTVTAEGKTATGIPVPAEVVQALGSGKRPAVTVTINGFSYRSTVAPRGGQFLLPVSAANRAGAKVAAGDEVEVDLEVDLAPREVTIPADFGSALRAEPVARAFFEGLSYSQQSWFVLGIEGAKTDATRQRRIEAAIERLRSGRGQT